MMWSGISYREATSFLLYAINNTDPMQLPDYVIRPYVSRKNERTSYAQKQANPRFQDGTKVPQYEERI